MEIIDNSQGDEFNICLTEEMSYTKRFQIGRGNIEKLRRFPETKKLQKIEEEFSQSRGSGAEDRATGWATLTINTPGTKLRKELISSFKSWRTIPAFESP
jgi:hypothetical protein